METYIEETTGFNVLEFKDAYELLEYGSSEIPGHRNTERMTFKQCADRTKFTGVKTFKAAADLVKNGYKTAIKEISERQKKIIPQNRGNNFIYSDHGDFFDVGEVISGSPEPWLEESPQNDKPIYYDIIINPEIYAAVTKEEMYNFGAALLSLIDSLSTGNNIVNIKVCQINSGLTKFPGGKEQTIKIVYGINNQPLDVDLLGFILCHVAYSRRIINSCLEKFLETPSLMHCGYGKVSDIDTKGLGPYQFYIPCINSSNKHRFSTPESAWNYVKNLVGIEDN